MINDNRQFKIDFDFQDLIIDGKDEIIFDMPKYIGTYIKQFEIASIGVTIVYNNVIAGCSRPSGKGTMDNLYTLFELHEMRELTGNQTEMNDSHSASCV